MAHQLNTYPNYLIKNGLKQLISVESITYSKLKLPNDRIQYKTTYDNELLYSVKIYAMTNKVFINDLIEYSINFININELKKEKTNK